MTGVLETLAGTVSQSNNTQWNSAPRCLGLFSEIVSTHIIQAGTLANSSGQCKEPGHIFYYNAHSVALWVTVLLSNKLQSFKPEINTCWPHLCAQSADESPQWCKHAHQIDKISVSDSLDKTLVKEWRCRRESEVRQRVVKRFSLGWLQWLMTCLTPQRRITTSECVWTCAPVVRSARVDSQLMHDANLVRLADNSALTYFILLSLYGSLRNEAE